MTDDTKCRHESGADKHAKRQCTRTPTKDGYCTYHGAHPQRRNERALALVWEHRNEMAEQLLTELAEIGLNAESTGDRIRAAIGYLDRTGHGPNQAMSEEEASRIARATIDLIRDEGSESDDPA